MFFFICFIIKQYHYYSSHHHHHRTIAGALADWRAVSSTSYAQFIIHIPVPFFVQASKAPSQGDSKHTSLLKRRDCPRIYYPRIASLCKCQVEFPNS